MQIEHLDGEFPNLRVRLGTKEVTLHSSYPMKEAERVVRHFNPSFSTVLVAGVGLGYVVDYLLKHTGYDVILYEHDDTFRSWNGAFLDAAGQQKCVKVFGGDPQALFDYLAEAGIGELNLFFHRPYVVLFPEVYDALHGMVVAYLSRRQINQATARRFQRVWVRNVLKNSLYYGCLRGVKEVFGSGRGYPAVVIGAGPSLAKNVHLLHEAKKKNFILIATDTVLAYLDKQGVATDFVVSVDPQDKNALYLLASRQRPWLVLDSGASFLTFAHYARERILLYDTVLPLYQVFKSYWGEKGEVQCGGSVSTAAFDFAVRLGCEPIVFVGQDLAYSERQTHAPHNTLETMLYTVVDRYRTVEAYNATSQTFSDRIEAPSWDGRGRVGTDRKFLTFKEWFVRRFREVGLEVINATEGGMHTPGARHERLADVVEIYGGLDKPYAVVVQSQENKGKSGFEGLLKQFRQATTRLRVASRRGDVEVCLLALVRENPAFGRLMEMTMQDSIQALLSSSEVSKEKTEKLRREIVEGVEFLDYMIEKRLKMGGASCE